MAQFKIEFKRVGINRDGFSVQFIDEACYPEVPADINNLYKMLNL